MLGEFWPGSWKAWVQVWALPLAGRVMPGTSHYVSSGQGDQNLCVSMEAFCHRAGGHPFQVGLPSLKPLRKLPEGPSSLGLAHTRPQSPQERR